MSQVEDLLAPISYEAPCGEDLEYDPAFGEMERAAAGKPEQQMGDQVVEAQEPDWRAVRKQAAELLTRSKDLRIAVYYARASLMTEGFSGFRDGLALLRAFVEQYWEPVHPRLDPEDDNDPTMRVNTIVTLCDADTTLRAVREAPLVSSRVVGRFSLRDVQIASGEAPAPEGVEPPTTATIEAAFTDCELDELSATGAALTEALEHVKAIETTITEQVGVTNAPNLDDLVNMLQPCLQIVSEHLLRRGVGVEETAAEEAEGGGENGAAPAAQRLTGEIHSREDVIRALDKVCEYYERHEPSSPLPLLIRRAKRLATKSFLEIIRDLAPDALGQAVAIGGADENGEEGYQ
ncbi:MAG: type VI secretion system protein TssA [Planctomycetes bacterium]|nr:type VI secretion system protein TssA [Planctomycetota bacterium]